MGGANTIYVRCANLTDKTRVSDARTIEVDIASQPMTALGAMQALTSANCPAYTVDRAKRTVFDARDNQIYYVGKSGNLCWMMSNLRYSGNGNWNSGWGWADDRYATNKSNNTANTNDDARPLGFSTPAGWAVTTPSAGGAGGSSDYTNTSPNGGFYGNHYNWCAAMGGQASACQETASTQPATNITLCPAGWRLPTGGTNSELQAMLNVSNFRNNFFIVYAGYPTSAVFSSQGTATYYWSSNVSPSVTSNAMALYISSSNGYIERRAKYDSLSVRCVR